MNCPACAAGERHTAIERAKFHPLAGHGCHDGKWTSGDAERAAIAEREALKAAGK